MADAISPFRTRPITLLAEGNTFTGVGGRVGYSPLPELGVELHGSWITYQKTYGIDVVYRPLAGSHQITPILRAGVSLVDSNWYPGGRYEWQAAFDVQPGLEWRHPSGFSLSFGLGLVVQGPKQDGFFIAPSASLGLGYSF